MSAPCDHTPLSMKWKDVGGRDLFDTGNFFSQAIVAFDILIGIFWSIVITSQTFVKKMIEIKL